MKTSSLGSAVLLACLPASVWAQSTGNIVITGPGKPAATTNVTVSTNTTVTSVVTANNTTAAADADWKGVQRLFQPLTPANAQGRITVERQAAQFQQASLQAKAFYTKFPKDDRVAEARKLEALGALQAAQLAGTQYAKDAIALGDKFRGDKSVAVKDRVDVAIAMEAVAMRNKPGGKRLGEDVVHAGDFADRIFAEFGDAEEAHQVVAGLMRASDVAPAQGLAAKLNQRNSPAWAKADAQKVNDRAGLSQRTITELLSSTGIAASQLGLASNQPTVLFFWGKNDEEADMAALRAAGISAGNVAKWVYYGLGVPANQTVLKQPPFAGSFFGDPAEFRSPLADAVGVAQTPWVCVLDKNGKIAGSGRVKDLPGFLAAAGK